MRSDVSCLMFQSVEGFLTQRTSVGSRQVLPWIFWPSLHASYQRGDIHHAHSSGHAGTSSIVVLLMWRFWVQQIREIHCRRGALHVTVARSAITIVQRVPRSDNERFFSHSPNYRMCSVKYRIMHRSSSYPVSSGQSQSPAGVCTIVTSDAI